MARWVCKPGKSWDFFEICFNVLMHSCEKLWGAVRLNKFS